ncbi:MAG: hypothetical protein LBQ73_08350 [Tannerellaceae bacterium]|nr:hypothetical protein [Tannerellaceae bacterium]
MQKDKLRFSISNYSDKLSDKETFKKRYFYDNGLLTIFLSDPEPKLLENLLAIALKKEYKDELYFYHKNIEVDFFIPQARRAIQVSYRMIDENTRQREVKALLKLSGTYALERLEIVTWDEETLIHEKEAVIQVIPIWKWLLTV